MKPLISAIVIFSQLAGQAFANPCGQQICAPRVVRHNVVRQHAVVQKVVKQVVPVVQRQELIHYFVGYPANSGYAPLQQAQYGQIERQMQRLQDRLQDLRDSQQQYSSYQQQQQSYAPPQQTYAQPQHHNAPYQPPAPQAAPQHCDACQLAQQQLAATGSVPQALLNTQPTNRQTPVLNEYCAICHQGTKSKGGFNLEKLSQMSADERLNVAQMIASGEMPKDGEKLTDERLGQALAEIFSPEELSELARMFREPTPTKGSDP